MISHLLEKVVWGAPSFWIERFPLYWGIHQEYFKDQGIDLHIQYSCGGPELARAFNGGSVHIGEMGLPPFATAYQQGMSARIIGSSVIQQLDHYLAARPDIISIDGLAGRRIGILSGGSCDDYFIRKILATREIDLDGDVELVPLGKDYGKPGLIADRHVDAAFVVEPQLARGEHEGLLRVIDRVADYYPRYQWGIILASPAWLNQKMDLLGRLMYAFRKACRSIKDHPGLTIALGSRIFGVAPEVFEIALMRDLPRWGINAKLDRAGLQNALNVQEEMGVSTSDLSLDEIVQQL